MKHFAWVLFGVCCSAPLAAQDLNVFTPSRRSDAPVFMNGQVVRVDRAAGTLTLRSDSGLRVLHVDRQALASLADLRPGHSVILGLRSTGSRGSDRSVVMDIRPTGVVAPSRGRVSASASITSSGGRSIGTAEVVSVDRNGRRMTVVDSAGATRVLDVRGDAVGRLGALQPGDSVALGVAAPLVEGTPAGTVTSIDGARSEERRLASGLRVSNRGTLTTFNNDSLTRPPGLPAGPNDGLDRNPGSTGVQPVPGAQPIPGVQGPTGVQPVPGAQPLPGTPGGLSAQPVPGMQQGATGIQPVPGAQPLPGTGVTGQTASNPGLTTQPVPGTPGQPGINSAATGQATTNPGLTPLPVPGTGGQSAVNAGATGGVSTGVNTGGAATTGVSGGSASGLPGNVATVPGISGLSGGMSASGGRGGSAQGRSSSGTVGGGSPVLGPAVPQLGGVSTGGINSQIPSIPPSRGTLNTPVLPPPSVMPGTIVPTTPSEVSTLRELASRDFDLAVAALAARAADVDRAWVAYRSQCVSSTVPLNNRSREWFGVLDGSLIGPTEDICEASFNEVTRLAMGIEASLDNARDTARQADVLPGRMREVLQRYNLDL